jgi:hypothetical protein
MALVGKIEGSQRGILRGKLMKMVVEIRGNLMTNSFCS